MESIEIDEKPLMPTYDFNNEAFLSGHRAALLVHEMAFHLDQGAYVPHAASYYFWLYVLSHDINKFDHNIIMLACYLLASKTSENNISIAKIYLAFKFVRYNREYSIDQNLQEFNDARSRISEAETHLMEFLDWNYEVPSPEFQICNTILHLPEDMSSSEEQRLWGILNDVFCSGVCVCCSDDLLAAVTLTLWEATTAANLAANVQADRRIYREYYADKVSENDLNHILASMVEYYTVLKGLDRLREIEIENQKQLSSIGQRLKTTLQKYESEVMPTDDAVEFNSNPNVLRDRRFDQAHNVLTTGFSMHDETRKKQNDVLDELRQWIESTDISAPIETTQSLPSNQYGVLMEDADADDIDYDLLLRQYASLSVDNAVTTAISDNLIPVSSTPRSLLKDVLWQDEEEEEEDTTIVDENGNPIRRPSSMTDMIRSSIDVENNVRKLYHQQLQMLEDDHEKEMERLRWRYEESDGWKTKPVLDLERTIRVLTKDVNDKEAATDTLGNESLELTNQIQAINRQIASAQLQSNNEQTELDNLIQELQKQLNVYRVVFMKADEILFQTPRSPHGMSEEGQNASSSEDSLEIRNYGKKLRDLENQGEVEIQRARQTGRDQGEREGKKANREGVIEEVDKRVRQRVREEENRLREEIKDEKRKQWRSQEVDRVLAAKQKEEEDWKSRIIPVMTENAALRDELQSMGIIFNPDEASAPVTPRTATPQSAERPIRKKKKKTEIPESEMLMTEVSSDEFESESETGSSEETLSLAQTPQLSQRDIQSPDVKERTVSPQSVVEQEEDNNLLVLFEEQKQRLEQLRAELKSLQANRQPRTTVGRGRNVAGAKDEEIKLKKENTVLSNTLTQLKHEIRQLEMEKKKAEARKQKEEERQKEIQEKILRGEEVNEADYQIEESEESEEEVVVPTAVVSNKEERLEALQNQLNHAASVESALRLRLDSQSDTIQSFASVLGMIVMSETGYKTEQDDARGTGNVKVHSFAEQFAREQDALRTQIDEKFEEGEEENETLDMIEQITTRELTMYEKTEEILNLLLNNDPFAPRDDVVIDEMIHSLVSPQSVDNSLSTPPHPSSSRPFSSEHGRPLSGASRPRSSGEPRPASSKSPIKSLSPTHRSLTPGSVHSTVRTPSPIRALSREEIQRGLSAEHERMLEEERETGRQQLSLEQEKRAEKVAVIFFRFAQKLMQREAVDRIMKMLNEQEDEDEDDDQAAEMNTLLRHSPEHVEERKLKKKEIAEKIQSRIKQQLEVKEQRIDRQTRQKQNEIDSERSANLAALLNSSATQQLLARQIRKSIENTKSAKRDSPERSRSPRRTPLLESDPQFAFSMELVDMIRVMKRSFPEVRLEFDRWLEEQDFSWTDVEEWMMDNDPNSTMKAQIRAESQSDADGGGDARHERRGGRRENEGNAKRVWSQHGNTLIVETRSPKDDVFSSSVKGIGLIKPAPKPKSQNPEQQSSLATEAQEAEWRARKSPADPQQKGALDPFLSLSASSMSRRPPSQSTAKSSSPTKSPTFRNTSPRRPPSKEREGQISPQGRLRPESKEVELSGNTQSGFELSISGMTRNDEARRPIPRKHSSSRLTRGEKLLLLDGD
ncbi:hypothetical protein BLNAU_12733 [Blattamonas nauphoetae]|uniref:Uncharacterized protein n=1 Tax=Blattamonas nauphoetae TaxID=2049346 RepID=A0ABQ9XLX8_9EUKA|nr:hypothetical protein BLNAU_12733 [Blattamonas nauphoetae]